jgi:imidazolonepropionase-like amidohydrolase
VIALVAPLASAALVLAGASRQPGPEPGAAGGSGLALKARKILTASWDGPQVVDDGVLLIRDGKIEAVGRAREVAIPEGYELLDVGERWLAPGLIDLHSHEAGISLYSFVNDLNDMVYLTNPGVRASASVEPGVPAMRMGLAGGVTTVLYIPGSGTNIGGQGVLVKTPFDRYEENLVRAPGSMKLAQWGNPEAWTIGIGMSFENWNTRHALRRGVGYAKRWKAFEEGGGEEPERDISYDVFRDLLSNDIAISTHTQVYQVVLMTLTMIHGELGLPVFLDHSTIGGWLTGAIAQEMGVPAIVGPREIDPTSRRFIAWARNKHEGVRGVAAGYQERGHTMVGFNTDAPVVPQQELSVQAAMGARYGFQDERMDVLRGLTIVPARAAKIDDRVGSLEAGKDADVLVVTGHPADPRTSMEVVFVDGRRAYDAERDGRQW